MRSALPSAVQARILFLGENMEHSVKHARVSCKRKERMILAFSTKLVEMATPDDPSYATAIKLAEALRVLRMALENCHEWDKAGRRLEYVLELRVCKDTVSYQLTRDGNAAEWQLPSQHASFFRRNVYISIIIYYNKIDMQTAFRAKVRKIGSSFGVLIPKKLLAESSIKEGEEIEISLLKKRPELISKAFGSMKGARHFKRDETDRTK